MCVLILCFVLFQDPSVTQVTEPPPSGGAGTEDYNPFSEEGKPKKQESQVRSLYLTIYEEVYTVEPRTGSQ